MAGYTGTKEDHLKRLRRIEGQVRGISRMVEEDTYCFFPKKPSINLQHYNDNQLVLF